MPDRFLSPRLANGYHKSHDLRAEGGCPSCDGLWHRSRRSPMDRASATTDAPIGFSGPGIPFESPRRRLPVRRVGESLPPTKATQLE